MWRPIETAPKDGTYILARYSGFLPAIVRWVDTYGFSEEHEEINCGSQSDYKPDNKN